MLAIDTSLQRDPTDLRKPVGMGTDHSDISGLRVRIVEWNILLYSEEERILLVR